MPPGARAGRPWSDQLYGETAEINEVATLLRQWIDEASINVSELHAKLTDDHFPRQDGADSKASRLPAKSKLYDHLNAKVLTREMAEAIIDVTTQESAVQQSRLAQVRDLFRKIDEDPTPVIVPGVLYSELQKARKAIDVKQNEIDKLHHARRLSDQAHSEAQAIATRLYFLYANYVCNRVESLTRDRDRLKSQLDSRPAVESELISLQQRLARAVANEKATAETLKLAEEDVQTARRMAEEANRLLLEKEKEIGRLRQETTETIVVEEPAPPAEARPAEQPAPIPVGYDIDDEGATETEVEIAREQLDTNRRELLGEASKELAIFMPREQGYIEGEVVPPAETGLSENNPNNPPTGPDESAPSPAKTSATRAGRDPVDPAESAPQRRSWRRKGLSLPREQAVERRKKWLTMAIIYTGVLLCSFSAIGALLVLPQIRDGLSLTSNGTQLVIAGDLAGLAAGLLWVHPAQARFASRSLFRAGAFALAAGSAQFVIPGAPEAAWLLMARVLQGLGQGLLLASVPALLEAVRNNRKQGDPWPSGGFDRSVWRHSATAFAVAGMGTGIAAGAVARQWGWHWVFQGPAWLGGALLIAVILVLPADPALRAEPATGIAPLKNRMDHMTRINRRVSALHLAGLLATVAAIGQAITHPWYSLLVLAPLVFGIYAMEKSVTWDSREEDRYSPPSPSAAISQRLAAVLGAQVLYVAPVYLVLYLYDALGYDVFGIAALMCAVFVPQSMAGWTARQLTVLSRLLIHGAGLLCAGSGLLLVSRVSPVGDGLEDVLVPLAMVGIGSMAIRMGHPPSPSGFPQTIWRTACASGALGVAGASVLADRLATGYRQAAVAPTEQQLFAQTYGGVLFAAAACAGIAALVIAAFPAASGAEPREWPAFVQLIGYFLGDAVILAFALIPAFLAAVAATGFSQALDTDPRPDLSYLILYVLLCLTGLALATCFVIAKMTTMRSEPTSGKEWSRFSGVLTGTAVLGAVTGIPLGSFLSIGFLTATGTWFASSVGLL